MSSTSSHTVGAQKNQKLPEKRGSNRSEPSGKPSPAASEQQDSDFAAAFKKRMKEANSKPKDATTAAPAGAGGPAPSVSPIRAPQPPNRAASNGAVPTPESSTETLKPAPSTARETGSVLSSTPLPAANKASKQKQTAATATSTAASNAPKTAAPAPSAAIPAPTAAASVSKQAPSASNAAKSVTAAASNVKTVPAPKSPAPAATAAYPAKPDAPKPALAAADTASKGKGGQAAPAASQQSANGAKKAAGKGAEPIPSAPSHQGPQYSTVPVPKSAAAAATTSKNMPKYESDKILQALSREVGVRKAEAMNIGKPDPPAVAKNTKPPAPPATVKAQAVPPAPPAIVKAQAVPPAATKGKIPAAKPAASATKSKGAAKGAATAGSGSDDESDSGYESGSDARNAFLASLPTTTEGLEAYPDGNSDDSEGVPDLISSSDDEGPKPRSRQDQTRILDRVRMYKERRQEASSAAAATARGEKMYSSHVPDSGFGFPSSPLPDDIDVSLQQAYGYKLSVTDCGAQIEARLSQSSAASLRSGAKPQW